MPVRPPRICGLCGRIHLSYERCPTAIERDRQRKAAFDQTRLSARERGYSSKWEKARSDYLKHHPTCAICGQPATVVDHIKPHKGDNKLFWDKTNWQSLCSHCHNSTKQSQERRT